VKVIKPGSTTLYPVPAVVVSCGLERPNLITLAWVGTTCSDPPSVGIAVRPERFSHGLLLEAGEFVVNLPRADQVPIVDYCGQVSGRDVDKWAKCNLTPAPASKIRTPLIAEFPMALECRVTHHLELGAHDLFIGEVLAVQVDEEVLDSKSHLDTRQAKPFVYVGGYYYELGKQLGMHGDWRKEFEGE
jgi:flavin reductase (DIM6/NTAB) family NADH-FMN oxidoreductase RutF